MHRSASARPQRPTRCCPTPSAAPPTTASGTTGCAGAASRPATSISAICRTSSGPSSGSRSSGRRGGGARPNRGADAAALTEISLAEAFTGSTASVRVRVARTCETCGGDGAEPGTSPATCVTCRGSGRVQQVSQSVFGQFVRTGVCPRCEGAGRVVESPCRACEGGGRLLQERTIEVEIPAGIDDGQRIRLRGEGHAGSFGGPSGTISYRCACGRKPASNGTAATSIAMADLTMTQAALGATVTVPGPEGEVEVEVPAGTQPGSVHVLKGRGMPSLQSGRRGDLNVHVRVRVPRSLDADQRRVLETLGAELGDDRLRRGRGLLRPPQERVSLRCEWRGDGAGAMSERLVRRDRARPRGGRRGGEGERPRARSRRIRGVAARRHPPTRLYVGEDRVDAIPRLRCGRDRGGGGRLGGGLARLSSTGAGRGNLDRAALGTSAAGQPAVVIDPGRAFGTGAHADDTALHRAARAKSGADRCSTSAAAPGPLDCGARLGYGPVIAVDDDPVAVEVTARNAAVNGVGVDARVLDATTATAAARRRRGREHPARCRRAGTAPHRRRSRRSPRATGPESGRPHRDGAARGWRSRRLGGRSFVRATD